MYFNLKIILFFRVFPIQKLYIGNMELDHIFVLSHTFVANTALSLTSMSILVDDFDSYIALTTYRKCTTKIYGPTHTLCLSLFCRLCM